MNNHKKSPKTIGRQKHSIRFWVQLGFFIVTLAVGLQFAAYVVQMDDPMGVTIQRPPGVEGFLPIGALMGWKSFLITGTWDPVHPAAMVILGVASLLSWVLCKSFCGWICPVGTLSEWVWKLGGRFMGQNFRLPIWVDYPLRSIKYLLLGFFVWVIFNMDHAAIEAFIHSPYYKVSDVKMLHFFTRMTTLTAAVLLVITAASLFVRNFWCRYLCPYGALMGIFAFVGPTRVHRNEHHCIDCGKCAKQCAYYLPVDKKSRIRSAECIGCMECTNACPVPGALQLKTAGLRHNVWSTVSVAAIVLVLFVGSVYLARVTGHWQGNVKDQEFHFLLKRIDAPEMTHPK